MTGLLWLLFLIGYSTPIRRQTIILDFITHTR